MAAKTYMSAAFALISVILWSLVSQATTALPGPFQVISGVDGATHLQTAQSLVLGIGYIDGLIWITVIAAVIGSLLAQTSFDSDEI